MIPLLPAALCALLVLPASGADSAIDAADPAGLSALSAQFWTEFAEMERLLLAMRAAREAAADADPLDPVLEGHQLLSSEFKTRLERASDLRHRYRTLSRAFRGAIVVLGREAKSGSRSETDAAYAALYAQEGEINRMRSHREEIGDRFEAEVTAFAAALEARQAARRERLAAGITAAGIMAIALGAWLRSR